MNRGAKNTFFSYPFDGLNGLTGRYTRAVAISVRVRVLFSSRCSYHCRHGPSLLPPLHVANTGILPLIPPPFAILAMNCGTALRS